MSVVHYLQSLRSVAFWKLPAAVLVPLTPTDLEPGAAVGVSDGSSASAPYSILGCLGVQYASGAASVTRAGAGTPRCTHSSILMKCSAPALSHPAYTASSCAQRAHSPLAFAGAAMCCLAWPHAMHVGRYTHRPSHNLVPCSGLPASLASMHRSLCHSTIVLHAIDSSIHCPDSSSFIIFLILIIILHPHLCFIIFASLNPACHPDLYIHTDLHTCGTCTP